MGVAVFCVFLGVVVTQLSSLSKSWNCLLKMSAFYFINHSWPFIATGSVSLDSTVDGKYLGKKNNNNATTKNSANKK